jgi:hypothetical protein
MPEVKHFENSKEELGAGLPPLSFVSGLEEISNFLVSASTVEIGETTRGCTYNNFLSSGGFW